MDVSQFSLEFLWKFTKISQNFPPIYVFHPNGVEYDFLSSKNVDAIIMHVSMGVIQYFIPRWKVFTHIFHSHLEMYTDPAPTPPRARPPLVKTAALIPQSRERLKFYFGRFFNNSLEIVIFSIEIEVKKCKNRSHFHHWFVFFSKDFLIHNVL